MRPQRKLNLNWQDPVARRGYKRADMRKRRLFARGQISWDATTLFARAMDRARRTQVALPRDPVLDAWRVQRVVRVAFDSRFGPYRPVVDGHSKVPRSEDGGEERVAPPGLVEATRRIQTRSGQ